MTLHRAEGARDGLDLSSVVAGGAVSASDWARVAHAQRWLLAHGRTLVPAFRPSTPTLAKSTAYTYGIRLVPSVHAIQRVWAVTMRGTAEGTVTAEGVARTLGAWPDFTIGTRFSNPRPTTSLINVSSQTTTESGVDLTIDAGENGVCDAIACHEMPRAYVDDGGTELAASAVPFRSGQPITANAFANLASTHQETEYGKRVHLHWAVPYKVNAAASTTFARSSTSSTYADILDADAPILGRTLYTGDTTRTVTARVLAWRSSTATGDVRLVSTSGGNGTAVALPATTTPTWSNAFTVTIDAEDLTVADGRVGSAWDTAQIEFRRTAGSGTVYVASAIIYEA